MTDRSQNCFVQNFDGDEQLTKKQIKMLNHIYDKFPFINIAVSYKIIQFRCMKHMYFVQYQGQITR